MDYLDLVREEVLKEAATLITPLRPQVDIQKKDP